MNISPQKRSSLDVTAPVGQMLGNKFLSFARSRLPVANKPRPRAHRRSFLGVAPVPFAPLVDAHAFQPPPPYSAHARDSVESLPVPHNTPETPAPPGTEHLYHASARPIGLGLEGVENGDGGRFDGLGRLSGGFRGGGTSDTLREEVQRMLTEHSRRRRTRASEQPAKCHDVFYASVEVQACDAAASLPARTVKIRIRRRSAASPTPGPRVWEGVGRGTISSELKRAASLERRASLQHATAAAWRV